MSSTKVVIIVLVIIVALFVVLMIWGAGNNSSQSSSSQSDSDAAASFNSKPHAFLSSLSGRLGYGPKIDAKQLQPALKTFDLAKQGYQVKVLADSDNSFRRAAIKVQPVSTPSCAHVSFTPAPVDGMSDDLKKTQRSDDSSIKNPNDFTFTIPKGGGELVVEPRSPNKPCTVTLE
jgi:hypothetical protein